MLITIGAVIQIIRRMLSDYQRLKQLGLGAAVPWSTVCQISNSFVTDRGQAMYFEILRTQRVEILDYRDDLPMPLFKGTKAAEQAARLKEQIHGLQE